MFIRRTTIKSRANGEPYFTYRLVESERIDGRVKQRILLNLGRHFSLGREHWKALCARIEQLIDGQESMFEMALPEEMEKQAQRYAARILADRSEVVEESDTHFVAVDVDRLEVARPRTVGVEQLAEKDPGSDQARSIHWQRDNKPGSQATHPGVYCLRTDIQEWDEQRLWKTYTLLTDLEAVFRSLKTELGLRPIHHQKTDRISGHLFISLLAYQLVHTLRVQLKAKGFHYGWEQLRQIFSTRMRVTVTLPTREGKTLHIRKATRPEPHQQTLYDALGMPHQAGQHQRTMQ